MGIIKEAGNREFITGVIYCYTNKVNGKKYVGQTVNEDKRKKEHRKDSRKKDTHFYKAINKYGWSNFKYQILHKRTYLSKEEAEFNLDLLEITYIDKFNSYHKGYNSTYGGHSNLGLKLSDETKRKISEAKKGQISYWRGKQHSEESRKKMSEAQKKLGLFKGEKNPNYGKGKKVVQLSKDNTLIAVYRTITEASILTYTDRKGISRCCRKMKNYNTANNYKWQFLDEYEKETGYKK